MADLANILDLQWRFVLLSRDSISPCVKPLEHPLLLLSHFSDTPHADILAASILVHHRDGTFVPKLPLEHCPPAVHPKALLSIIMDPRVELESGTFRPIEHLANEILLSLCTFEQTVPQLIVYV